jgi:hypothetical protein
VRLVVAATAFSLIASPIVFAGQGRGHAPVSHGLAGQHGQAGQHGKAGEPHGKAGAEHGTKTQSSADIAANISRNPKLQARLEAMLPSGMTLEQAASGFRNQGQFIAALEASKKQNIPFADLKAQMTGNPPLSLGQPIQKLKPATTTGTGNGTEKPEPPDTDKD